MISALHEVDDRTRRVLDVAQDFLTDQASRYWFSRAYVCIDVLLTAWLSVFGGYSLNRAAILELQFGVLPLVVMTTLATLGLIDLVINDLMPERFHFGWGRRNRWILFMGIALTMAALIYANTRNDNALPIIVRYVLECLGSFVLAFLDIAERGPRQRDRRRTN